MIITALGNNQHYGRDKGEAGAQIGGNLALSDEDIEQRAHTIHKKAGGWVHIEQEGHQDCRAKHRE